MESPDLFETHFARWEDMTQAERVKYWLENIGPITPLEAWTELGIYRVASPIHDLRETGMKIENVTETVLNRFGKKVTFAKYQLEKEE